MKYLNGILLVIFGFIMFYGLEGMFSDNFSPPIAYSIEYLRAVEVTIIEVGMFIGGTIGFFAELMYFNWLLMNKGKE